MRKYPFKLRNDETLIEVEAWLGEFGEYCNMALDTGATHTLLDLTKIPISGYSMEDVIASVPFETAKGRIEALVFRLDRFEALGKVQCNFEVCAYDFLGNNMLNARFGLFQRA